MFRFTIIMCLLSLLYTNDALSDQSHEVNLIESVTVRKNVVKVEINKDFRKRFLKSDFYAKYEDDINLELLDPSIQIMPCIMNLVSIVWISGRDYYIDVMDAELFESLKKVKEVLRRMYPHTKWNGNLIPRKLVTNDFPPQKTTGKERTALLFSGGVDSTASSLYHNDKKQLLITVQGHWDLPLYDKKLWKIRKDQLTEWAKRMGHENEFIESNYYEFLNRTVLDHYSHEISSWRIFTVEGIGWVGLAAPVMLLKGYPILRHASTITWEFNFPAAANPFIDDNIHFAGASLKHDLFDMNRLEKCAFIAKTCKEKNLKKPFIRVCEEKTVGNCGRCQKCLRTILEFVVIGEDPQPYGFHISIPAALKKSRSFMAQHGTGATTVWHFMHIQKKLQEKIQKGESIPQDLQWILDFNLKKKLTSEVKNQKRLDWRSFKDLLPDIDVPEHIELAF